MVSNGLAPTGKAIALSHPLHSTFPYPSSKEVMLSSKLPRLHSSASRSAASLGFRQRLSTFQLPPRSVVLSGIQPTGVPHLGNYLGALLPWLRMQQTAPKDTVLTFSIVDLHAITANQNPHELRRWRKEMLASLLAIGLSPERCTMFFQSDVPAHAELMWVLSCTASMGYLSRMTQWKSKSSLPEDATIADASSKASLKLGLFSYPVLQAADILLHEATHVPVGEDQEQHIEFTRDCAERFNRTYGDTLILPQAVLSPAKRVMSLKEPRKKMSKSHHDPKSRILLTDRRRAIEEKVKAALTDSEPGITYDPERRPGVSNLLDVLSYLDEKAPSPENLAKEFENSTLGALKAQVAKRIDESIAEPRERLEKLLEADSEKILEDAANRGKVTANQTSSKVLKRVYDKIGIGP